jgi:hypothetical protein
MIKGFKSSWQDGCVAAWYWIESWMVGTSGWVASKARRRAIYAKGRGFRRTGKI